MSLIRHPCHNCVIGNEGKIVAEKRPAYNNGGEQGGAVARLTGHANGNRSERHYRPHTCTYRERYYAGGQEKTGKYHVTGKEMERKVDGGLNATHGFR